MWMHLNGAWSSSWPAPGEGIDEASYHSTPARSTKLIQSVPDQTQHREGNIQHPHQKQKNVWKTPACFHAAHVLEVSHRHTPTMQAAFPEGRSLGLFWLVGGGKLCVRLNRGRCWRKAAGTLVSTPSASTSTACTTRPWTLSGHCYRCMSKNPG